ncbi:hypothetical protein HHI36_010275 [Cryptolaemus montrouzieri]|uniref:Methylenetetrahydrofolate reductase (NAD(P)H) n=1 Tax=Cryptolaemus montrouzieri TaxID=559131 RepID=A0ABD2MIA6_9CUCU
MEKSRLCSLEISTHRPVDFKLLKSIPSSFCSVIWLGTYDKPPHQKDPLVLSKKLIENGYTVVLHFAGRNNTKESCIAVLDYAKEIGIRNLMVVRGATPECNIPDKNYDFPHTPNLINFIKEKYGDYFDMCVAGFPYKHPESKDLADDMKYLKEKNDAGAKFIITQAAFSYQVYKDFLRNCREHGITMQIIPGLYVIRSVVDFCFLQRLCKVPQDDPIVQRLKKLEGDDKEIATLGIEVSMEVVKHLMADLEFCPPHLYTMDELGSIKQFLKDVEKK